MDKIYNIACKIKQSIINKENLETNNEYLQFQTKYPKLYMMLQDPNMDNEMFEKLFNVIMVDSTENGASTFSEFGAEKYLYPSLGKPTVQDREIAKQKINKHI